jgi:hypothetical protein
MLCYSDSDRENKERNVSEVAAEHVIRYFDPDITVGRLQYQE